MMFQIVKSGTPQYTFVQRAYDGAVIPMDEANADYQQYLEWLAAGNEPKIIESEV